MILIPEDAHRIFPAVISIFIIDKFLLNTPYNPGDLCFVFTLVVVAVELLADLGHVRQSPASLREVQHLLLNFGQRNPIALCPGNDAPNQEFLRLPRIGERSHRTFYSRVPGVPYLLCLPGPPASPMLARWGDCRQMWNSTHLPPQLPETLVPRGRHDGRSPGLQAGEPEIEKKRPLGSELRVGEGLQRLAENSVLYQGTTLACPERSAEGAESNGCRKARK
jgi:hypothetical protein